jgi:hypothetical protein
MARATANPAFPGRDGIGSLTGARNCDTIAGNASNGDPMVRTLLLMLAAASSLSAQSLFTDLDWSRYGSDLGSVTVGGDAFVKVVGPDNIESGCSPLGQEIWVEFVAPVDGRATFTM